jgi:N-acetylneuraminic acid mutarotase
MNKYAVLALFLISLTASSLVDIHPAQASADYWVTKAPIPVAMTVAGTAALNGQIYAFGVDINEMPINYVYNPATDNWTEKAPMPTARGTFGIAIYQNKIYVVGGANYFGVGSFNVNVNEVYDPVADKWTTKASMPLNVTGISASIVNEKIYIISGLMPAEPGNPEGVVSNATQIYDPATDTWTIAATPIPIPVYYYVSAVIDNKIYVAGGSPSNAVSTNQLQIYDPENDQWTLGTPLPTAVTEAGATATLGVNAPKRLYVIGGRTSGPALALNQIYDPQTQSWTIGTPFPTTHDYITEGITATNLDDTLYFVGGIAHSNEGFYELTEQYIPVDYNVPISSPSPSPSVPEFPSVVILPLLITVAIGMCLLSYFKKRDHTRINKHCEIEQSST